MSNEENTATQTDLPYDPVVHIVGVVNTVDTQVQVLNDVTITGNSAAAERLNSDSQIASHKAGEHMVAQVASENRAGIASSTAENTASEDVYYSQESTAQKETQSAQTHHIANNVESAKADDSAAKAAALARISEVKIAVAEVEKRSEFATQEVEIRTQIAVAEKMKGEASTDDSASTLDQETALKAAANISEDAPKIV